MNPLAIQGGIQVLTGIAGLFKRKGKPMENVEAALETVGQFVKKDLPSDPEAIKLLKDHELELEREYTKRAQSALDVMGIEANSKDPWVRRARPMLMYMGYLVLASVFIACPFTGTKITDFVDKEILYWFFWMFSSGYLGYGVLRTADKNSMQIPGFGGKK